MPHVAPNSPSELHARAEEDHRQLLQNRVYYPQLCQAGFIAFADEADTPPRFQNREYYPAHLQAAFDGMDPAAVDECERQGPNSLPGARNTTRNLPCRWHHAIQTAILGSPVKTLTVMDISIVLQKRFPLCTTVRTKLIRQTLGRYTQFTTAGYHGLGPVRLWVYSETETPGPRPSKKTKKGKEAQQPSNGIVAQYDLLGVEETMRQASQRAEFSSLAPTE
ncbi:hypothetical protein JB92DRAFT_277510 [Gautieria morchelliformis]|nr:hypothetical protein JB92DRAFT_277510 [Gautieria morchelliformis]